MFCKVGCIQCTVITCKDAMSIIITGYWLLSIRYCKCMFGHELIQQCMMLPENFVSFKL
jgi:hypothetical protein